jgi:hypothetical protein
MLNLSYQVKQKKARYCVPFNLSSQHQLTKGWPTTPQHKRQQHPFTTCPPPHPIRFKLLLSSRRVIIPIIRIISGERGRHVNHVKNVSFLSTF